jgi:4-hydroxyphenylpyruvate dioxygenase-like putative hemolysin
MGFTHVAKHRSKDVDLYRQGDINFIVNREPKSHGRLLSPPSTAPAPAAWRSA